MTALEVNSYSGLSLLYIRGFLVFSAERQRNNPLYLERTRFPQLGYAAYLLVWTQRQNVPPIQRSLLVSTCGLLEYSIALPSRREGSRS